MKDYLSHGNPPGSRATICKQGLPSLIHLLHRRLQEHGEKVVYTYLKDGESQETRLTYCELDAGRSPLRHISNLTTLREIESFCSTLQAPNFPRHFSGVYVRAWSPCLRLPLNSGMRNGLWCCIELPLQKACSRDGHMRLDTSAESFLEAFRLKVNGLESDVMGTEGAMELSRVIESNISKKVADLLKISVSRVDVHSPLNMLGIDSLMAIELKTAIEEDMGIGFPVEVLFLGAGISGLTAPVLWQRRTGRGLDAKDGPLGKAPEILPECPPFEDYPEYQNLRQIMLGMNARGIDNPYFRVHEGADSNGASAEGREHITFSRYNYLGMSGDPVVSQAAKDAIDDYGTSVSASRLVSGERRLHREIEAEIAELIGTENSLVFVSGHATNVTTIGHLFGKPDLIVHDSLIHNSVLQEGAPTGDAPP